MAQLVIAFAGASIGGALAGPGALFLGMNGAQIGWMAGSMLGSMLAGKQRTAGPRLDELRVSGTEYGNGIAWVAGAPRVAGDLIWSSDRREIATTEEVGKGGGGSEYTSYTYEIDALYLLADQPDAIVTRCWDNGKLIWTNLASADDASRLASEQAAKWRRITVYNGADAQLPDPTYEAAVTHAPAYTRRLCVFIESMQLGSSGTLPNLTFEVASLGDTNPNFVRRYEVADTGWQFADLYNSGAGYPGLLAISPAVRVTIQHDTATTVYLYELDGTTAGTATRESDENYPALPGNNGGTVPTNFPVGMLGGEPVRCSNHFYALGTETHIRRGAKLAGAWGLGILPDLANVLPSGRYLSNTMPCSDGAHLLVMTAPTPTYTGGAVADRWHIIGIDGGGLPVLVDSGDVETPRPHQVYGNCAQQNYSFQCGMLEDDLQHVWIANGAGDGWLEMLKIEPDGVMRSRSIMNDALLQHFFTYPSIWAEGSFAVVVSRQSYQAFRRAGDVIDEVPLQDVIEALCDRATMPAGTYDASALASITQPVRALAVTNGSARQALEILQSSHGFDAYVTDKLYFVPRGGSPVLTVDADDLAAGDNDAQDEPFALTLNSDLEMPSRIAVVFKNMSADQVNGTEHSDRGPTGQDSIQTIQLAIGMTPGEAKGVADAMVRDAYAARLTSQLSLPMAYTQLTPTDVIQVPGSEGTLYRMRITRRSDSGGIMTIDVVGDDGEVVVAEMATSDSYTQQTTVSSLSETLLYPLDIPILRDADDSPGYYVAARGVSNPWPGAAVFSSANSIDYAVVATVGENATMGTCTTTLGPWAGGAVMDEINSVTVSMAAGELASTTRDALLLDRSLNAMMIGSELIQFTTVELLSASPNVYKLTRLLRGLRGTEWASAGHSANERAVLLQPRGIRQVAQQLDDTHRPIYLKGLTAGQSLADVAAAQFTNNNTRLMAFAPVDLRYSRDANGSFSMEWKRRTRLATTFCGPGGIKVPLDEAVEAYEIDVMNGASVVRTITAQSASAYYSGEDQITDFGSVQTVVNIRLRQISKIASNNYLSAAMQTAYEPSAQTSTIELSGTFTQPVTVVVKANFVVIASITTAPADVDLSGVASRLVSIILAAGFGYTAAIGGSSTSVDVTGLVGRTFTLEVDVGGSSSMSYAITQQAQQTSNMIPYEARIFLVNRLDSAAKILPKGTTLGINIQWQQTNTNNFAGHSYSFTTPSGSDDNLMSTETAISYLTTFGLMVDDYALSRNTIGAGTKIICDPTYWMPTISSGGASYPWSLDVVVVNPGSLAKVSNTAQVATITVAGVVVAGEEFIATIDGIQYTYIAVGGDGINEVAAGIASAIDSGPLYASSTGAAVTITGLSSGVQFGLKTSIQRIMAVAIT